MIYGKYGNIKNYQIQITGVISKNGEIDHQFSV